ncbi:MAG: phosphatase PAP2 family protein [Methanobacteriota archaeon]|nr:MAG: phosphatase PAP2 family protein [Euryarchaeota archaeon]
MGLNEDLFHALNGAGNPALDPLMVGLGVVGLLYIAILWAFPLWFGNRRREAMDLVVLLLLDALLVLLLKNAFQVPRPFTVPSIGARVLAVPLDDVADYSFPSGHTTRAFAAAILLTARTRRWRWGVPLFAYATLMAVSRVYVGVHWPSDVVGGAILGIVWGYGFQRFAGIPWYEVRRDRLVAWLERFGASARG